MNCGLVRDHGIDRTVDDEIDAGTPRASRQNSAIVLVEWPMVKNVFVSGSVDMANAVIATSITSELWSKHTVSPGL